MSATTMNSNINSFVQKAKESRSSYKDDKDWARAFSRSYWHTVSNQPGFLPVYTSLLNSITNTSTTQTQVEEVTNTISQMAIEKEADRTPVTPPRPKRESTPPSAPLKPKNNSFTNASLEEKINTFILNVKQFRNDHHTDESWARAEARHFYHFVSKEPGFLPIYKSLIASLSTPTTYTIPPMNRLSPTPITQEGKKQLNNILFKEYDDWYEAFEEEVKEDPERSPSADERWVWHSATVLSKRTKIARHSLVPVVEAWLQEHKSFTS